MPREIRAVPGSAALSASWRIEAPDSSDDRYAVELLRGDAETLFGWRWSIAHSPGGDRLVRLRPVTRIAGVPETVAAQGYRLTITRTRIVIEGASARGRFYGLQTLRQMLRASPQGRLPCLTLTDFPSMEWRGVSDDISRGQVSTLADFKAIIRQLAYYKINLYQLYLQDFAGPTSGRRAPPETGALSAEEIEQIVEEGRRNHVVVCPIFQTLGHEDQLQALAARMGRAADREPDGAQAPAGGWERLTGAIRGVLARLGNLGGPLAAVPPQLSPDDPRALRYVQGLVEEIAARTRGPFFHVGGDEWALLRDTTRLDRAARSRAAGAYGHYLAALARHLRETYGCRTMVYGDVLLQLPEAARALPHDVIVVDWHYDPADSFPSLELLRNEGIRSIVVSTGLWNWSTFYPNYARGFHNIAAFTRAGKRAGAMGSVVSSWGDDGAENLRENNWLGYAFSAAAAWESDAPATDPFVRRFVVTQYGADSPELARAERLLGWQEFEGVPSVGQLYRRPPLVRPRAPAWV